MNKKETLGFNAESFVNNDGQDKKELIVSSPTDVVETKPKKKKSESSSQAKMDVNTYTPQTSMSYIQDNIPYQIAYRETNQQLDESIMQLNAIGGELMSDLQMVRASKTLKNKYNIINDMTENTVGVINAKIAAIKEKNNTIGKVNDLEIRRVKELKIQASQEDDNTRIANLYNAFVNTPIGAGPAVLGPAIQDTMLVGGANNMQRVSIGDDQAAWEQSLNPAERRMTLEAKGVIDTVVVYDEATGNRFYQVVDKNTRQPVPNVETPDASDIYNLDINVRGGFAKDSNRNAIYPLVVVNSNNSNSNGSINEY